MKTIFRTILILLVAAFVAGALSLAVNNTSIASGFSEEGERPAMTTADGQTVQPMERPEGGDHDSASLVQGLSGVLGMLIKLSAITILVLALEKGFDQIHRMKRTFARG